MTGTYPNLHFCRRLINRQGRGRTFADFIQTRIIRDELRNIYLSPLFGNANITIGGAIKEGVFTLIEEQDSLSMLLVYRLHLF